jgi:serine protease inhibitor
MKREIFIGLIIILVIIFVSCDKYPTSPDPKTFLEIRVFEKSIIDAENSFGFSLFQQVAAEDLKRNVIISPVNISLVFNLLLNGATGETQNAIKSTLGLSNQSLSDINLTSKNLIDFFEEIDSNSQFQVNNSLWYCHDYNLEKSFISTNSTYFHSQFQSTDFKSMSANDSIDQWVVTNTNRQVGGKSNEAISPATSMLAISAFSYYGKWSYSFDDKLTHAGWFNLVDGSLSQCEMMIQRNKFNFFENLDCRAIDLPFSNGLYIMTILMPTSSNSIEDLVTKLNPSNWEKWLSQFHADSVTVTLPKCYLDYNLSFNEIQAPIGMETVFSSQANFTKLNTANQLKMTEIRHNLHIEFTEQGLVPATNNTGIEYDIANPTTNSEQFTVNRPFVFIIREKVTQSILALGKVMNPAQI